MESLPPLAWIKSGYPLHRSCHGRRRLSACRCQRRRAGCECPIWLRFGSRKIESNHFHHRPRLCFWMHLLLRWNHFQAHHEWFLALIPLNGVVRTIEGIIRVVAPDRVSRILTEDDVISKATVNGPPCWPKIRSSPPLPSSCRDHRLTDGAVVVIVDGVPLTRSGDWVASGVGPISAASARIQVLLTRTATNSSLVLNGQDLFADRWSPCPKGWLQRRLPHLPVCRLGQGVGRDNDKLLR